MLVYYGHYACNSAMLVAAVIQVSIRKQLLMTFCVSRGRKVLVYVVRVVSVASAATLTI